MKRFYFWLSFAIANLALAPMVVRAQSSVNSANSSTSTSSANFHANEGEGGLMFCGYNLKNYLKMERFVAGKRTEGVDKPEREVAAVVRFLTEINADILGVSEIGSKEDLEDLRRRLSENGVVYTHVEHAHGGDPVRSLGLLSKLPIVERNSQTNLVYQMGTQTMPMQRGILDVVVQVNPSTRLHCVGVHLKSKRAVSEGDESLMRRNEARLLRKHLDAILTRNPETLLLTYGDFNEHAHEAPIRDIETGTSKELAIRSLKLLDARGQSWTHYWTFADVYSRFDYVFVNPALSRRVDRKASYIYDVPNFLEGSDHRPLVVRFKFGKK